MAHDLWQNNLRLASAIVWLTLLCLFAFLYKGTHRTGLRAHLTPGWRHFHRPKYTCKYPVFKWNHFWNFERIWILGGHCLTQGTLQSGFSSGHLRAYSGWLASSLWLLEIWWPELSGRIEQHFKVHLPASLIPPSYFPSTYFSYLSWVYFILSYCVHLCKPSPIISGTGWDIIKDIIISVYA